MKNYNRNNCDSKLRAVVTDRLGRQIFLYGKHAFEWEIVMESDGKVIIHQYPNRAEAMKDFKKYKAKR